MQDVLDLEPQMQGGEVGPWRPFAYFAPDGRCAASIDAGILPLVVNGEMRRVGAIRSVAVAPGWRGRGLFRELMREALLWCDADATLTLLYTEQPEIYRSFGFRELVQHAIVGRAPAPASASPARRLTLGSPRDAALLREAVTGRPPVSLSCALLVDTPLFVANVAKDADIRLAHAADHDAIVLYERDDEMLTLVDIVGTAIPDLARVLGLLEIAPRRVKTLFPPDRLDWSGEPVAEETGLMVRGAVPAAMTRPFMFPPTAEF